SAAAGGCVGPGRWSRGGERMAGQRPWGAGLSWLLVGCKGSDGTSPPLPPCTSGTPLALAIGAYQSIDPGPVSGCIVFPASVSATEYLLVPQAATGTPNDTQSFKLVGSALTPSAMASLVAPPGPAPAAGGAESVVSGAAAAVPPGGTAAGGAGGRPGVTAAPAAVHTRRLRHDQLVQGVRQSRLRHPEDRRRRADEDRAAHRPVRRHCR